MRLFIAVFILVLTVPVWGNSLWQDAGFGGRLLTDHRARAVGDTLTIIFDETSAASHAANTKLASGSNLSVGPGTGLLSFGPQPTVGNAVSESDSFQGQGKTDRSSSLSGMISATITEILPNGEMRIKGKKEMLINNETQVMEISGIVRPENISLTNTIQSSYVADAKIGYNGAGPVGDSQSPGIFSRIFEWLF